MNRQPPFNLPHLGGEISSKSLVFFKKQSFLQLAKPLQIFNSIVRVFSFTPGKINPGVQASVKSGLKYNCLVYLPFSYEQREKPYSLLLFRHGAGERGININLVKTHGPPKIVEFPTSMQSLFGDEAFPFLLISPPCPSDWWWENVTLHDLINEVLKNSDVDSSRIYLTGLSMGGFGI